MEITIREEKNSHFSFYGGKKELITSHETTLYHPQLIKAIWNMFKKIDQQ